MAIQQATFDRTISVFHTNNSLPVRWSQQTDTEYSDVYTLHFYTDMLPFLFREFLCWGQSQSQWHYIFCRHRRPAVIYLT